MDLADFVTQLETILKMLFGDDWRSQLEIIAEVGLAMLLGGLIGFERESADKPAGFRTHMLVAGAATLLVGLGDALLTSFDVETGTQIVSDPIRIVEAIITGVSFLGAGTIFRSERGETVRGLTTAASLLLSAAWLASTLAPAHVSPSSSSTSYVPLATANP